jgi:hypothetical protein
MDLPREILIEVGSGERSAKAATSVSDYSGAIKKSAEAIVVARRRAER